MIALWVVYVVAALAGIATPIVLRRREANPDVDAVRDALARVNQSPASLGMLAGGPARMVDAVVVDLVERDAVRADAGALTILQRDMTGIDMCDLTVMSGIKDDGAGGIAAVRDGSSRIGSMFVSTFVSLGPLVISPLRRTWEPAGLALATLAAIALVTFAMIGVADSLDGDGGAAIGIAAAGWLPITIAVAVLTTCRRGYKGPDPRSALGVACTALAQRQLSGHASQSRRVALGGFEAMTDRALRAAVRGNAESGTWPANRKQNERAIDRFALAMVRPAQAD